MEYEHLVHIYEHLVHIPSFHPINTLWACSVQVYSDGLNFCAEPCDETDSEWVQLRRTRNLISWQLNTLAGPGLAIQNLCSHSYCDRSSDPAAG